MPVQTSSDYTTVRVKKDTKFNLNAIKNKYLAETGENFSMDEVIETLIKEHLGIQD